MFPMPHAIMWRMATAEGDFMEPEPNLEIVLSEIALSFVALGSYLGIKNQRRTQTVIHYA